MQRFDKQSDRKLEIAFGYRIGYIENTRNIPFDAKVRFYDRKSKPGELWPQDGVHNRYRSLVAPADPQTSVDENFSLSHSIFRLMDEEKAICLLSAASV